MKIIRFLYPRYHPKYNSRYSKKCTKNKCFYLNEVIWLMRMKMRLKMKNSLHRCDINRHGHKYSKYKMWLSMMMLICIKQHLSNILSSIHENVKQHWGLVEALLKALLKKTKAFSFLGGVFPGSISYFVYSWKTKIWMESFCDSFNFLFMSLLRYFNSLPDYFGESIVSFAYSR